MSFFPATIPTNTLLYHGTHTNETVKGMEWLAFEIEHAEMFARARGPGRGGPGGPGGKPPNGPPPDGERPPPFARGEEGDTSPPYPFHEGEDSPYHFNEEEQPGISRDTNEDEESHGYLHIYQTLHPLTKLLYIDGMSAAKCPLGTLDTTDVILLNNSLSFSSTFDHHPGNHAAEEDSEPEKPKPTHPNSDYARAQGLCVLAEEWGVQGFIRMEAGFELILCDFSSHVKLIAANQRRDPPRSDGERGPPGDVKEGETDVAGFEYLRGLEQRYNGITNKRIVVDYSRMVSVYFYPEVNLTNPNGERAELPRLSEEESLEFVKDAVGETFKSEGNGDESVDWQGVADMIISRYTTRLPFLLQLSNSNSSTSVSTALGVVGVLLDVFIDYGNVNLTTSAGKCAGQYLRPIVSGEGLKTKADHLIHDSLLIVTSKICDTLFDVRESLLSTESSTEGESSLDVEVGEKISTLIDYLNWATWKECGKCDIDQVCFVAIWPWGDVDDHDHPKCVGVGGMARSRRGYWNTAWGRKN